MRMAEPALHEPTIGPVGAFGHLLHRVRMIQTARADFIDKAMPGPIRYTVIGPWKIGLHTTETSGLPTYQGGAVAPQLTVDVKARRTYRHYDYTRYAGKAFKHPPGTPATNTVRIVQIEVIGYCDDHRKTSPYHVSNWTDLDYAYLNGVLRQVAADTGCPLKSTVRWKGYGLGVVPFTRAGVDNGVRLSRSAFADYSGVLGHEHVPDNDHGDPGNPDMRRLLAVPAPPPTPARRKGKIMLLGTVKNDNRSFYGDGVMCRWVQDQGYYNILVAAGAYVIPFEFDSYKGMYAAIGRRDPLSDPGTSKVSPPIPAGQTDPALYHYTPPAAA